MRCSTLEQHVSTQTRRPSPPGLPVGFPSLFRGDCCRLRRSLVSQLRSCVSFRGLIQSRLCVLLASLVSPLIAMLGSRAMALGCVFMFLRCGSVRFSYVGFFVHGNTPFIGPGRSKTSRLPHFHI